LTLRPHCSRNTLRTPGGGLSVGWTQQLGLNVEIDYAGKPESFPLAALLKMATGYWVSQTVYVAAKLGIADLRKKGPPSTKPTME